MKTRSLTARKKPIGTHCVVPVALPTQRATISTTSTLASAALECAGLVLGAAIRQQLQRLYAEEWFREPDARLALQEFWRQSPSQTFEDLVAQVNGSTLVIDAVVADLLSDL